MHSLDPVKAVKEVGFSHRLLNQYLPLSNAVESATDSSTNLQGLGKGKVALLRHSLRSGRPSMPL